MRLPPWFLPLFATSLLCGCHRPAGSPDAGEPADAATVDAGSDAGVPPAQRCAIPLDRFLESSQGATLAKQVASADDLVGGPNAYGKIGDFLIANDKIKVVLQGPDRHIGPNPYGGTILDADLRRDGPGQDQFGELGLFYNLARTVDPDFVEILSGGGEGQSAIVAMSGHDTAHNYLRIKNVFAVPSLDLDKALPFKITNYFIVNPGEQRVRYVTAFCNEGPEEIATIAGDLTDPGWTVELFNGESCTHGFGYGGLCQGIDRMSWFGYQGVGVAYGYAPYRPDAPYLPSVTNATMTISAVTGTLVGADGLSGVSDWLNPDLKTRQGELRVPPGEARAFARDFVIGKDIGEVASLIETWRGAITGTRVGSFGGTVTRGGAPLPAARVSLQRDGAVSAVFVTDEHGHWGGQLSVGTYLASAWASGSRATPDPNPATLTVDPAHEANLDFDLSVPRLLTVSVHDVTDGGPLPAKVTAICATGECPAPWGALNRFTDVVRDPIPDNVQLIDFVPLSGEATFELPPGEYRVIVSRGPEWSMDPEDFPDGSQGNYLDLRTADGRLDALLAHVVDTTGWASADFHVHGVNSPDSYIDPPTRVLTFVAEGVDVLVSTDHDYVTDYWPTIHALGAERLVTTIAGEEVSPVDFGHTNIYPLTPDKDDVITGGAIDWAGGRGATLSTAQVFAQARAKGATSVHINHPRGTPLGVLSDLKVDMDTLATHVDPAQFGAAPQPGATDDDTKMIAPDFNAYEVLNSGTDLFDVYFARPTFNDWFTLLSRGLKVAAVGTSDTHQRFAAAAGYWRTWVKVADDSPEKITPAQVSAAVNAQQALVGDGPFVVIRAARAAKDGTLTSDYFGPGECVPASSDDVLISLDIQAPTFMDLSKVELYLHTPGDDARCPLDPQGPHASTARVACGGDVNSNWPDSGIAATQALTLGPGDKELVAQSGSRSFYRWHKTVTFRLPAPSTDNWMVAMVYGEKTLFPLFYPNVLASGGAKPAMPFALTNPIYVDADGNGFDHPPFSPPVQKMGRAPPKRPAVDFFFALSPEEITRRWGRFATQY